MTYDFSAFKIPVFPNINDRPVEPTSSKAGNGAHLIGKFNSLVEQTQSSLNLLQNNIENLLSNSSNWIFISSDYQASNGDRIILETNPPPATPFSIALPPSPNRGDWVEMINLNGAFEITILNIPKFNGNGYYDRIWLQAPMELVGLIYCGDTYGWLPTRQDIFSFSAAGANT